MPQFISGVLIIIKSYDLKCYREVINCIHNIQDRTTDINSLDNQQINLIIGKNKAELMAILYRRIKYASYHKRIAKWINFIS